MDRQLFSILAESTDGDDRIRRAVIGVVGPLDDTGEGAAG